MKPTPGHTRGSIWTKCRDALLTNHSGRRQGQGQDQDQGQGQGQDHLQLQQRAALPHLLMVLTLNLTLVLVLTLVLAPSGMINKKGMIIKKFGIGICVTFCVIFDSDSDSDRWRSTEFCDAHS